MPIAEGVATSIRWKQYATGAITPATKPAIATDPNTSGGVLLRRTSSSLNLRKDGYAATEVQTHRQVSDFRHGVRRVEGSLETELAPGNLTRFYEAVFRTGVNVAFTRGNADFTSVTSDNATSSFTFAAGAPGVGNFRVGDVVRFTGLAATANNDRNFLVLGFSGASDRVMTVWPAPVTDAVPDTSFSITRPGTNLFISSTVALSRKFLIEAYSADLDTSRVFEECRATGFRISLPATGMATSSVSFLGRDMQVLSGAGAPFFTGPTSPPASGLTAAVNGTLRVGGTQVGIVTAIDIAVDLAAEAPAVVGQNLVADIMLGTIRVTGTLTALFEDATLLNLFLNESEASVLVLLESQTAQPSPAITFLMPRCKFNTGDVEVRGEGAQTISLAFQALLPASTPVGMITTTMFIHDTEGS